MKNNKGFTLVEIICVIALLLLIATIAVPSIITTRSRNEEKNEAKMKELIENSAEAYFELNRGKIANMSDLTTSSGICLPLKYIVNAGLLKVADNMDIDNTYIKLIKQNNAIIYEYKGCNSENITFKN